MSRRAVAVVFSIAATSCGWQGWLGEAQPLDSASLSNAEYRLPFSPDAVVRVRDGKWSRDDSDGPETLTIADRGLRGDLDGDGYPDAVVLMVYWGGGSGVFHYLAVVRNERGHPRHFSSVGLGDRVKVGAMVLNEGRVTVSLIVQGENDPMCCPTVPTTRTFALAGNELVEVGGG